MGVTSFKRILNTKCSLYFIIINRKLDKMKTLGIIDYAGAYTCVYYKHFIRQGYKIVQIQNPINIPIIFELEKPLVVLINLDQVNFADYNFIMELKEAYAQSYCKIIAISCSYDNIQLAINRNTDDFLKYPFDPDELFLRVNLAFRQIEKQEKIINSEREKLAEKLNSICIHELNTPLNGILGLSQILIQRNARNGFSKTDELVKGINSSALRLKHLIGNLITYRLIRTYELGAGDFLKFIEGSCQITKRKVADIFKTIFTYCPTINNVNIELQQSELQIPEDILELILHEIISNAYKFTRGGNPVTVEGMITDDSYSLIIKNKGIGLNKDKIEKISAFMQFDRDRYEQQGLGLGLFICQKLIAYNKGELIIDANENGEVTVEIKLLINKAPKVINKQNSFMVESQ